MGKEAGTREFWLHIVQSDKKQDIRPMGFVVRRPDVTGDLFYLGAGYWGRDVTKALTFEHLADAEVLQATLQAEREAHPDPAQALNPVMAEMGLMPRLQVMFWGMADGEPSVMTALW